MQIRPETPTDAAAIRPALDAAFGGAPHDDGTEAAIVEVLRLAGAMTLSLVAESEGRTLGHVAFSPVTVDGAEVGLMGLGPLASPSTRSEGLRCVAMAPASSAASGAALRQGLPAAAGRRHALCRDPQDTRQSPRAPSAWIGPGAGSAARWTMPCSWRQCLILGRGAARWSPKVSSDIASTGDPTRPHGPAALGP